MGIKRFIKFLNQPADEFINPDRGITSEELGRSWIRRKAFRKNFSNKWSKSLAGVPPLVCILVMATMMVYEDAVNELFPKFVISATFLICVFILFVYFIIFIIYFRKVLDQPEDPFEVPLYSEEED